MKRLFSWLVLIFSVACLTFFWIGLIKIVQGYTARSGLRVLFLSSQVLYQLISGYLWDLAPDRNSRLSVWGTLFVIASFGPWANAKLKQREVFQSPSPSQVSTKQSYLVTIFLSIIAGVITKLLFG
jgi:hypothetical protein